jgi:hypothetical protein
MRFIPDQTLRLTAGDLCYPAPEAQSTASRPRVQGFEHVELRAHTSRLRHSVNYNQRTRTPAERSVLAQLRRELTPERFCTAARVQAACHHDLMFRTVGFCEVHPTRGGRCRAGHRKQLTGPPAVFTSRLAGQEPNDPVARWSRAPNGHYYAAKGPGLGLGGGPWGRRVVLRRDAPWPGSPERDMVSSELRADSLDS